MKSSVNPVVAVVIVVIVLAIIIAIGWKTTAKKVMGKDPSNAMKGMQEANPGGMVVPEPSAEGDSGTDEADDEDSG